MKIQISLDKLPKDGFAIIAGKDGKPVAAVCDYEYFDYISKLMKAVKQAIDEGKNDKEEEQQP